MPSTETRVAGRGTPGRSNDAAGTSLVTRVARSTAAAAAVAALGASALSLSLADRLVRDAEDARLLEAATTALRELPQGADRAALDRAVADEIVELGPSSLRMAVFAGGERIGGEANLPVADAGRCVSLELPAVRACRVGGDALSVVVGTARPPSNVGGLLLVALLATSAAAAFAAIVGRRAARWALDPLTRLRQSLDAVVADDPKPQVVAGDDGCQEVASLRDALRELLGRLSEALDTSRRFSAEAAHELKTPLTAIRAELELLMEEPLDDASRAAVSRVEMRAAALSTLVERLLTLASVTDGAKLSREAVAMDDVVRDVAGRLSSTARARLHVTSSGPGVVSGDEALLGALIENVVDNALKFSGEAQIDVVLREEGARIVLEVRDRGPGIPEAERARVFEAFFRAGAARAGDAPGHGVGLALVARVAKVHGGSAELSAPSEGPGCVARIVLPAWTARRTAPPSPGRP